MTLLAAMRKLWHSIAPRRHSDVEEEFCSTLDAYQEDLIRRGLSEEEAHRKARIDFGQPAKQGEKYRDAIGLRLLDELGADIRYGLRAVLRNPGFALVAVLSLALGIGATTAIFSIVEGVLLRPLPFADPGRLVVLGDTVPGLDMGSNGHIGVTMPQILTYEREARGFAALGGFERAGYEFSGAGAPAKISAARVTASIFPLLGVAPLMGRTFTQQEDHGSQQVTVISYAMWRSRFSRDPKILGRKIDLNRKTYEIIGVMPSGFEFPLIPGQMDQSQLWVPLSPTPDELNHAHQQQFGEIGAGDSLRLRSPDA